MFHFKIIFRILGSLLFVEALLLLTCMAQSLYFCENDTQAFLFSAAIAFCAGVIFFYKGRNAENYMGRRDSFLSICLSWTCFCLIGMLPFIFSGRITSVTDAFFETVSGLSTTGATIVDNLDTFPHGLKFWRCLLQWMGGLGIVLFTMVLLPKVGAGGTKLFSVESTGPQKLRLHPHIKKTVVGLWTVYVFLTLLCAASLWLCGMNLFDSLSHALSTTSTGGFSTHQEGISWFHSARIEYVEILFMFLSGINFSMLYILLIRHKVKPLLRETEIKAYFLIAFSVATLIAILLIFSSGYSVEHALRSAFFQVISLQTSTGFVSEDFMQWMPAAWTLLNFVMVVGACAGSTCGGIKAIRLVILFRLAQNEFRHILSPHAVLPVRINHTPIGNDMIRSLTAFVFLYFILIFVSVFCFVSMGIGCMDAFGLSIASLGNIGPFVGESFGGANTLRALPALGKWLSALLMLIGRLEVFSLLILLYRGFWTKN